MTQKRDLSEDKIIQTAIEIINENNYDSATFKRIAEKLNCKTQALYFYFKNRDDLNLAVTQKYFGELDNQIKTECLGYSGKDGLIKIAKVMREFGLKNLSLSLLALKTSEISEDKSIGEAVLRLKAIMYTFIEDFVTDDEAKLTITRGIRALVIGEVVNEGIGWFHNPLIKNTDSFEINLGKILN
ncbi:TetR/AcrR family transcriptional regulator [Companilactobacillus jidongensis]|uniref:TetR/AcrR family transcriptional regulator n=1 Tax=Companilactobacillus jidongensis TaxID=2486006 RepID=UPI000F79DD63|nr:TetR/AcrR family transcriptional regulator [Companilactobacillus jidongensis]